MEEKLIKVRGNCTSIYRFVSFLWVMLIILYIIAVVSTVVAIFTPSEAFRVINIPNDKFRVLCNNGFLGFDTQTPSAIQINRISDAVNAKIAYMVMSFATYITVLIPWIFILYYTKRTFYNMSFDATLFSSKSVKNIKKIGLIVIIISAIKAQLWYWLIKIFLTKDISMDIILSLVGILLGFLVLFLSRIFDYVCELQKEHDV